MAPHDRQRQPLTGAIVSGAAGTANEKIAAFEKAGVPVARIPSEIAGLLGEVAPELTK